MKLNYFVWGILLAATTPSALAQQDVANSGPLTGRIETVFVRESRNLFIEKKLLKRSDSKDLWAEVRVENPVRNEYVTELAKLPANMNVERGDLVEAVIADSTVSGFAQLSQFSPYAVAGGLAPLPEVNRITALVARRDTLRAMLFGLNNSQPRQSLSFEPQACIEKPTSLAYSDLNSRAAMTR
jgi:hypothetical protein